MPSQGSLSLADLPAGHRFGPQRLTLDEGFGQHYLEAIEEESPLFRRNPGPGGDPKCLPPLALAARALTALMAGYSLPPGAVHAAQELEWRQRVQVGATYTLSGRVVRNAVRGAWRLLTLELSVADQGVQPVLWGRATLTIPQGSEGKAGEG